MKAKFPRMAGRVYAIAGGRGGVGKTTTASNLGVVLGQAGLDVVVVDADLALASLGRRLGLAHEPSVHDVLTEDAAVSDAIVQGPGGMAVLTGERTLESYGTADARDLGDVFDLLTIAYDVVLVDTAAGFQQAAFVVFDEADATVLLATPDRVAVEDATRMASVVGETDGEVAGAAFTRADERAARAVVEHLSMDVLGVIPDHEVGVGTPIAAREPDGDAAAAYRKLAGTLPGIDADRVDPAVPDEAADAATVDDDETSERDPTTGETEATPDATIGAQVRAVQRSADGGGREERKRTDAADDAAGGEPADGGAASGVLDLATRQVDEED